MKDLLPKDWSYEKSVEKMKPLVYKWRNMTAEILNELWIAREKMRKVLVDKSKETGV